MREHKPLRRRGLILALIASAIIGGSGARAYAKTMPKLSGGRPLELTTAGEATFFMLGATFAATACVVAVSVSSVFAIEKCYGVAGLAYGAGIGLVVGLLTVPFLSLMFITVPIEVIEFLTQPRVDPPTP